MVKLFITSIIEHWCFSLWHLYTFPRENELDMSFQSFMMIHSYIGYSNRLMRGTYNLVLLMNGSKHNWLMVFISNQQPDAFLNKEVTIKPSLMGIGGNDMRAS